MIYLEAIGFFIAIIIVIIFSGAAGLDMGETNRQTTAANALFGVAFVIAVLLAAYHMARTLS